MSFYGHVKKFTAEAIFEYMKTKQPSDVTKYIMIKYQNNNKRPKIII